MTKSSFFARTKDDIAKSPVDFFSLGHIIMGQLIFFIVYLVLEYPLVDLGLNTEWWAVGISVLVGIAWEPIENTILWKMGLKFESRLDSWLNLIFDIIFWSLGALLGHWINNWIINLILVIVETVIFFILRWYFTTKL